MAIPRLCSSCDIVVLVRTQFCRVSASCRTRSVGLQSIRLFSSSGASFKSSDGSDEFFKPTASFGNAISESGDSVGSETVADVVREMVDISALGLGGFWPSGLIQHSMEMMYNYIHLPWWGSIVAMTVLLRLMIFPLAVKMQRTAAKLAVVNEEAKGLHAVIQQRKMTGDKLGESMAGIEMIKLYQRSGVHPFHMIIFPFAQVPVFLSMLRALYSMAKLPVESMTIGGALWFENLVVPDPYGCLPIFACITFLLNTEVNESVVTKKWSVKYTYHFLFKLS